MRERVSPDRTTTLVILAACLGAAALVGQMRPSAEPQATAGVPLLGGGSRPATQTDHAVLDALKRTGVTAAAVAVVRPTGIAYSHAVGQRIGARSAPADDRTIFRAASLGKAVFAYLVFTLVGDGRLDLDKPLHEYLSKPLPEYPEYADGVTSTRGIAPSTASRSRSCSVPAS